MLLKTGVGGGRIEGKGNEGGKGSGVGKMGP